MSFEVDMAEVTLPEFGVPTVEPVVPADTYEQRLQQAMEIAELHDLDALVVYGDREHSANLAYLTNYDPRFEEALLILVPSRKPTLLVGNEGLAYSEVSPLDLERVLYQSFSLPGQPRGDSLPLETILREAGIGKGQRIGVVGWKYFDAREADNYQQWIEIPAFIIETLTQIVGNRTSIQNATELFMSSKDGLRITNDVAQLAAFEFAATHTSQSVRNVLFGIRAGMTEYDVVRLMQLNGMPLSAHLMLSSGERASRGLSSPSMRVVEQGDPIFMAYGVWGALNARGGFVVHDATELPANIRDYVDKLVKPYFRAIVEWYEAVGIGVTGSELYEIVHQYLGDAFFGIGLNPGHLIHLDEWVNSPIYQDSNIQLQSGMVLQVDVIPVTHSPYFTTNIEDGIALADETLRHQFATNYPEAWGRIQQRRAFMDTVLGIRLKPEVLPFSNIPAYLPPFWLFPEKVMRVKH